jgi:hypothetical protein
VHPLEEGKVTLNNDLEALMEKQLIYLTVGLQCQIHDNDVINAYLFIPSSSLVLSCSPVGPMVSCRSALLVPCFSTPHTS